LKTQQGFEEFDHTADWGIRVWSPTLDGLLETAARGMLGLLEVEVDPFRSGEFQFSLSIDQEPELLLVSFLEEILYLSELHQMTFEHFEFVHSGRMLKVTISGRKVLRQKKEIKAVTFHNLVIGKDAQIFEAAIVFDV